MTHQGAGTIPPRKGLPRKRVPADLASLARSHTRMGVEQLAGIARDSPSEVNRMTAIAILFDRGWGKPHQVIAGPDGGALEIIIRRIDEDGRDLKLIEGSVNVQPK